MNRLPGTKHGYVEYGPITRMQLERDTRALFEEAYKIDPHHVDEAMRRIFGVEVYAWSRMTARQMSALRRILLSTVMRGRGDPRRGRPARRDPYPQWTPHYSGEDFDRTQRLALELTESDRRMGVPTERAGYSAERFKEASRIVRAARRDPRRARTDVSMGLVAGAILTSATVGAAVGGTVGYAIGKGRKRKASRHDPARTHHQRHALVQGRRVHYERRAGTYGKQTWIATVYGPRGRVTDIVETRDYRTLQRVLRGRGLPIGASADPAHKRARHVLRAPRRPR